MRYLKKKHMGIFTLKTQVLKKMTVKQIAIKCQIVCHRFIDFWQVIDYGII